MDLRQCLENLKYDIGNGGVDDDTFATTCYITMANKAHRLLESGASDQRTANDAKEYLTLCCSSESAGLRCVAKG